MGNRSFGKTGFALTRRVPPVVGVARARRPTQEVPQNTRRVKRRARKGFRVS